MKLKIAEISFILYFHYIRNEIANFDKKGEGKEMSLQILDPG